MTISTSHFNEEVGSPLLTEVSLNELLQWVPSHNRKFAEQAAIESFPGWQSKFDKSCSVDAMAKLLCLGGASFAESICKRAGIRGLVESAERNARKAVAPAARTGRLPPKGRWAAELARIGKLREAAWLLWVGKNIAPDWNPPAWLSEYPQIRSLIEGSEVVLTPFDHSNEPEPSHAQPPLPHKDEDEVLAKGLDESFALIGAELDSILRQHRMDSGELPGLLRLIADQLDQVSQEQKIAKEHRAQQLAEFQNRIACSEADIRRCGTDTVDQGLGLIALVGASLGELDGGKCQALVEHVETYSHAVSAWRRAFDELATTHDYAGVAEARKTELNAFESLSEIFRGHGPIAAEEGEVAGFLERGSVQQVDPQPAGIADSPATIDRQDTVRAADVVEPQRPSFSSRSVANGSVEGASGSEVTPVTERPSGTENPADLAVERLPKQEVTEVVAEAELLASQAVDGKTKHLELKAAAHEATSAALSGCSFALAEHISITSVNAGLKAPYGLSPTILRALTAGLKAGDYAAPRAAEIFDSQRPLVEAELEDGLPASAQLVVFAASLRPALFAIEASADRVLRQLTGLKEIARSVDALMVIASEVARRGQLNPLDLAEVGDQLAPQRQLELFRSELESYLEAAPSRRLKFQRATLIWSSFLRSGQVRDALDAIIADGPDAPDLVARAIDAIGDVDQAISTADRTLAGGRKVQMLTAGARATLGDWIQDLSDRLETWQRLNESRRHIDKNEYGFHSHNELRTALLESQRDLMSMEREDEATRLSIGVAIFAIDSVLAHFSGVERDDRYSLIDEQEMLLLFEKPPRSGEGAEWSSGDLLAYFADAKNVASTIPNFERAFERALGSGRFPDAMMARDQLLLDDVTRSPEIERRLVGEFDRQISNAKVEIGQARRRLNDLLGADDRQVLSRELAPTLDKLDSDLQDAAVYLDLCEWNAALTRVTREIDEGFLVLIGPLVNEIDALERQGTEVADLRKMVELKDLTTLSEHIEAYKQGVLIVDTPIDLMVAFNRFLNSNINPDISSALDLIENRGVLGDSDFANFDDLQIEAASSLLNAWHDLRRSAEGGTAGNLKGLFQSLLATSQIDVASKKKVNTIGAFNLKTPVFRSREECIAPAFGSEAGGEYDIILVDRRSVGTGAELAALKSNLNMPTFIIVKGIITDSARRTFMKQVRMAGATPPCALIDEALILFLVGRRLRGRSDFFMLALACGVVQPYSDIAQKTSPEMFFGRDEELKELWNPNGSCLVYGGRQLGKTALLRQIELRHNRPNHCVIYGDDDVEAFGRDGPSPFWRWVARRCQDRGITMPSRPSEASVHTAICAWLDEDRSRRLVILVDESDKLLHSEIKAEFKILLQVRELMRLTDRRCKFIFAGLHDVQRLARSPNSPLLHFGNPIRVGPLMGKDLFAARAMVEAPMAVAGYAFGENSAEGRALVGRALSEIGYYPSLMQSLGEVLVDRMNAKAASRLSGKSPVLPMRISEEELNHALRDDTFRNGVSTKFDATLNLDQRYRLIAYLVLIGTQDSGPSSLSRPGLSVAEIQREAMYWWPQGFVEDSSNSAFEGLLKEMEGLGVLVSLNDGRFAIRSARIAAMLGSTREVEDRVEEMAFQPYLTIDDTGSSRRMVASHAPSPLTFRQESVLLEPHDAPPLAVALSSPALGLNLVAGAVSDLVRGDHQLFVLDQKVSSVQQIERAISTVAVRAKEAGCQRGLLIATGPWLGREAFETIFSHSEVRRATRLSNQGRPQGVRVLLLPTLIDWREIYAQYDGDRLWGATLITLAPMQEAGVQEWMEHRLGIKVSDSASVEKARRATGGFPKILSDIEAKSQPAFEDAINETPKGRDFGSTLDDLGLSDPWLNSILRVLHEQYNGAVSLKDRAAMVTLMEEEGLNSVDHGLCVLEWLGALERILDPEVEPGWILNPFVATILSAEDAL